MSGANAISSLIERVEKATGPSFALDQDIELFVEPDRITERLAWERLGKPYPPTPPYTASLDAVVALAERVLPGWRWIIDSDWDRGPPYAAQVKRQGDAWSEAPREFAKTPPLALLLALLLAVQSQKKDEA